MAQTVDALFDCIQVLEDKALCDIMQNVVMEKIAYRED